MKNGALAVYEAFPSISAATVSRPSSLAVRFVKTVTRRLPIVVRARAKAGDNSIPPPKRELVEFESIDGYSGAFLTGEDPLWILASDHGPVRLFDHAEKGIYGFSKLSSNADGKEYVTQSRTVSHLIPRSWVLADELVLANDYCQATIRILFRSRITFY